MNMNIIARDGTLARLDELDKLERERKNPTTQQQNGAFVPMVTARYVAATPAKPVTRSYAWRPHKIRRSFKRYAEFLDAAKDEEDGKRRAKEIAEDIAERTTSRFEAESFLKELHEFMAAREKAKPPVDVGETPVSGDVD